MKPFLSLLDFIKSFLALYVIGIAIAGGMITIIKLYDYLNHL